MILAGIDIGTNSLRLLIADHDRGTLRPVHTERRTIRLGKDVDRTGMLSRESMEGALACMREYVNAAKRYGASRIAAAGTSALRNTANAAEFLTIVHRETGLAIRILSGEDEARLMLKGVAAAFRNRNSVDPAGNAMVVDIGGGSTEVLLARDGSTRELFSLPLGAVYLTERYFRNDPPAAQELSNAREHIRRELHVCRDALKRHQPGMLIGTAGTVTTLATMHMQLDVNDAGRINGVVMECGHIDALVEAMSMQNMQERARMRGLGIGRADIILAGSLILQEIMKLFGFSHIWVSDWGLREGLVLELADGCTG